MVLVKLPAEYIVKGSRGNEGKTRKARNETTTNTVCRQGTILPLIAELAGKFGHQML